MKKNKLTRLAILVLALAIGSMMIVSGTYAKYTSEITGTSSASVAKWAWTIGSELIDSAEDLAATHTFNLFSTIKDSDLSSTENDVNSGLIAPGTSGSFEVAITNSSEVNATYAIAFTATNSGNIPIEYSTNGTTWVTDVSSLNVSATNIAAGASAASNTTIYWRWAFTGATSSNFTSTQTDATDTTLGFAANSSAATLAVTTTITVTQVD